MCVCVQTLGGGYLVYGPVWTQSGDSLVSVTVRKVIEQN